MSGRGAAAVEEIVDDIVDGFELVVVDESDRRVVHLHGEADLYRAGEVAAALTPADDGQAEVVLDLCDTTFVDSSVLGVLVQAQRRLSRAGGRLTITEPNRDVYRVLEITGLSRRLDVRR